MSIAPRTAIDHLPQQRRLPRTPKRKNTIPWRDRKFQRVAETSLLLCCSQRTDQLVADGKLEAIRLPGGQIRVLTAGVITMLAEAPPLVPTEKPSLPASVRR